jgi:hypothetical protein
VSISDAAGSTSPCPTWSATGSRPLHCSPGPTTPQRVRWRPTCAIGAARTPQQYVQTRLRRQRLVVLLRLPVPAAAAARGDHRLLCLLPRGGRRGRRGARPVGGRHQAATGGARRWPPSQVRPTHPVMQALMPLAAAHGIQADHLQAVIEGCQMDLEQTRYPRLRVAAALLPSGGRRGGRGGGRHLRPHADADDRSTPTAWAWRCN